MINSENAKMVEIHLSCFAASSLPSVGFWVGKSCIHVFHCTKALSIDGTVSRSCVISYFTNTPVPFWLGNCAQQTTWLLYMHF